MIIFNHNLIFRNEPELRDEIQNDALETIFIIEEAGYPLFKTFPLKSAWLPTSGQEVQYRSSIPFEEADEKFSWALEIKGVVTLVWDAKERKIFYRKGDDFTAQRLRFWVFHTFFPIVLELERTYRILHVGSVEIGGKPVLFSASSFGGKSTLTDYFIRQGHTMLCDDSMAIEKRGNIYYAISSYPFHRPYRELETLGYPVENFATKSKPLHAVYLLEKSDPDAAVEITELKGIEKFKAFHYSSFINFNFMKQERFEFFTEMAKQIPVYRVTVPWDMERLEEVYDTIKTHNKT
ncbi:hypothetical protein ACLHDG_00845 [Sulfurovum sp. CS9]|uniref:hypothetical protein n=1 Tax=Sulfurovum sp. CS9 TaxID=3391146 RepID=UPI0039E953D4